MFRIKSSEKLMWLGEDEGGGWLGDLICKICYFMCLDLTLVCIFMKTINVAKFYFSVPPKKTIATVVTIECYIFTNDNCKFILFVLISSKSTEDSLEYLWANIITSEYFLLTEFNESIGKFETKIHIQNTKYFFYKEWK